MPGLPIPHLSCIIVNDITNFCFRLLQEPYDIAGMRVLLVEDNEINCETVEFMLKEAAKICSLNSSPIPIPVSSIINR